MTSLTKLGLLSTRSYVFSNSPRTNLTIQGCFIGAILSLFFGEKLGRRNCIMAGSVILTIGAALQASAFSIAHMIVGRIVAGIGNGMNTSAIRMSTIFQDE